MRNWNDPLFGLIELGLCFNRNVKRVPASYAPWRSLNSLGEWIGDTYSNTTREVSRSFVQVGWKSMENAKILAQIKIGTNACRSI